MSLERKLVDPDSKNRTASERAEHSPTRLVWSEIIDGNASSLGHNRRTELHDELHIVELRVHGQGTTLLNDTQLARESILLLIGPAQARAPHDGFDRGISAGPLSNWSATLVPASYQATVSGPALVIGLPIDHFMESGHTLRSAATVELPSSPLISSLHFLARAALSERTANPLENYALARAVRELLAGTMIDGERPFGHLGGAPGASTYDRAIATIRMRRTNSNFNVRELARALSTSERTLHRAFRERGTTPLAAIREQRSRLARTILADRDRRTTLKRVAAASGFTSVVSLKRALEATAPPHATGTSSSREPLGVDATVAPNPHAA